MEGIGMEWNAKKRLAFFFVNKPLSTFLYSFRFLGRNHFQQLVLECVVAVVVEKYLGNKCLVVYPSCQNAVRLSGRVRRFGGLCHAISPFDFGGKKRDFL